MFTFTNLHFYFGMSLPRRVPWACTEEFEHVFALLFSDLPDKLTAQQEAVNRVRYVNTSMR